MNRRVVKVNFSDFWPLRSVDRNPFFRLLSKKFTPEISEQPDYLFYSAFGNDYRKYDCVRIFCTAENLRPNFRECDYAFGFDYPITNRNYRFPSYAWRDPGCAKLKARKDIDALMQAKSKFCNFIYSNPKCKARNRFFEQLSAYQPVVSAGHFRNNTGVHLNHRAKIDFMTPFKFSIIFENASYPGYTTEKIYDAMVANTIPIYWGNPLVNLEFNPKAFINCHDYHSFDEVIERVVEVDQSERLYRAYLAEPYLRGNREPDYLTDDAIAARFEQIFATREPQRERAVSAPLKAPLPARLSSDYRGWKIGGGGANLSTSYEESPSARSSVG